MWQIYRFFCSRYCARKHLFLLNEVRSSEIKNIHDTYRKIKIVFTGSSVLQLIEGAADLSRRAMIYDLPGLSFREYLEFITEKNSGSNCTIGSI